MQNSLSITKDAFVGSLLGTAVGDALGLPCEGLTRRRQQRLYADIGSYHFVFGRGMVSDDTEHTIMTAQALAVSGGTVVEFRRILANQFRLWLLGIPAGVGWATLRAIMKLWIGFGPERSGVFSAGNGPSMRSPILGVFCSHDRDKLKDLVFSSTRLTHTDPKAEWGAYSIALAAAMATSTGSVDGSDYVAALENDLGQEAEEFLDLIRAAVRSCCEGKSATQYLTERGLTQGVSGYVYHTVPVVIQVWLRHQDAFETGMSEIIRCGGDTDTTAAIFGGICGAHVGKKGIPTYQLDGLWEWPQTSAWIECLGEKVALAALSGKGSTMLPAHGRIFRNLLFLVIVLAHGFRRLAPPY